MTSQVISVRHRRMSRAARPHVAVSKHLPQLEAMEVRRLLSTVVVNTLLDESVANATTSLREAIAVAASGDTVQFQPGLSGTITLGGSELVIDKNLTISGPGAGTLKLSGNDISQVLRITEGATVSMTGLTIRDGGGVSEGGGIYNAGSLTLNNCVISSNVAKAADGVLAGVPGPGDQLDGGAGRGGGIFNAGTLTLTDSTLSNNAVTGGNGVSRTTEPHEPQPGGEGGHGLGGAVYSTGAGSVTLTRAVVSNNTATGGTGLWAIGGLGAGGGVAYQGSGALAVTDSTFSGNKAVGGTVTSYSYYFDAAYAGGFGAGGAIYNNYAGALTVTGGAFSGNAAVGGVGSAGDQFAGTGGAAAGGAIWTSHDASISKATLSNNTATGGSGGELTYWIHMPHLTIGLGGHASGGAIYAANSLSVSGSTLSNNRATGGASGENWSGYFADLDPSAAAGGAISGHWATDVSDSVFTGNTAAGGPTELGGSATGGAIEQTDEMLTVTNSTFSGNSALATPGTRVNQRGAPATGGAISSQRLRTERSTFFGNRAVAGNGGPGDYDGEDEWAGGAGGTAVGGAIAIAEGGYDVVLLSTFSGNSAIGGDGGDGYQYAGGGGDARGGAIDSAIGGNLVVVACTIAGNTAVGGTGGSSAFASKAQDGQSIGGGVRGESLEFLSTIVATNTAKTGPDVAPTQHSLGFNLTSYGFNLIGKKDGSGGWIASDITGTAASPVNPLLSPLGDYGGPTQTMPPMNSSPAIDAGTHTDDTDQRGLPRTVDFAALANAAGGDGTDIGAVELQTFPGLPQTPFKDITIGATPVTIQVEDFDNGGEGSAYHDLNANNLGGAYRGNGVDLQKTADIGGGYNVGWAKAGEWLEYTVNVATAGSYDLAFRVASPTSGGTFHLEVDGKNVTGTLNVPNTGAWQTFRTVTKYRVRLESGTHVLRLALDKAGSSGSVGNFNYLKISPSSVAVTTDTAAHVRDGTYVGVNYGTSPTLEVKKSTVGYNREIVLKFNLADVPSTFNTAKLRLYGKLLGAENPSMTLAAQWSYYDAYWTERSMNWLNRPTPEATPLSTVVITGTSARWYEFDVTQHIKAAREAGRTQLTLVIRSTKLANVLCGFNSDEAESNRPQLAIWP